jgi:outer membrane protein
LQFAFADFMGIRGGGGTWNTSLHGTFGTVRGEVRDDNITEKDLGIDNYFSAYFWFEVEHPFPAIPNFRTMYTKIDFDGSKKLDRDIVFVQNNTFRANENVEYKVVLDQFDFTSYWELIDSIVEIDIGLNLKYISGEFRIAGENANNDEVRTFREFFPMGYGRAKLIMPDTNFGIVGEGYATFSSGSKNIYQYKIALLLESYSVGGEVGYKKEMIKFDNLSDSFADFELDGFYAALFFHF